MKNKIKEEVNRLSNELFIEHNINDRKTQKLISEYYEYKVRKRIAATQIKTDAIE